MEPERRYAEFRAENGVLKGTVVDYSDSAQFGSFTERFLPGSIRTDDPILNLQHDRGRPVARVGAGLVIEDGPARMHMQATLPETVYGREARELVDAGILRGLSIEFRAVKEKWDGHRRTILEAVMSGVALVDKPAYGRSEIEARLADMQGRPRLRRRVWL